MTCETLAINKDIARDILDKHSLCTIYGGYGMGICAFGGLMDSRPLLGIWNESEVPTEEELLKLQSFQEFKIKRWYNPTWIEKLMAMKPPQDEGCNTLVLRKGWRESGVWAYRRITWEYGPTFVDRKKNGQRFRQIDQMFDSIEDLCHGRWVKWKKDHSTIFA
jgi:hypothetical protein